MKNKDTYMSILPYTYRQVLGHAALVEIVKNFKIYLK